jgi:2-polyprenyl-3-methyl-5-hydroxy-6-metoxy-1,4-benzoquinol methylase
MNSIREAQREMGIRGKTLERVIISERPDLIGTFKLYQNEAMAARLLIDDSLLQLKHGGEVLEVGGGILALAIQLASEGYKVTTVEPVADGFTDIEYIMNLYLLHAREEGIKLDLLKARIEECKFDKHFDFIFSINVMEHLRNPYVVLEQLTERLNAKGNYRFICPNYDFPYEPHFGKWLLRRNEGAFFLEKNRAQSKQILDGEGLVLLDSINFLTLRKIKNLILGTETKIEADPLALYKIVSRAVEDLDLMARHPSVNTVLKILYALRMHHLLKFIPVNFQPIMDVRVSRLCN